MPIDVTNNSVRARIRNPSDFQPGSFRTITIDAKNGIKAVIGKPRGRSGTTIQSLIFPKEKFTTQQVKDWLRKHNMKTEETLEAVWTTKYVNDLPDSAFLYIEPGGRKDAEGKTKPRSLRHFPYKDANGKIDLPHLRNALARIPQSGLPDEVKRRVAAKARRIAKDAGMGVSEDFTARDREKLMLSKIVDALSAINDFLMRKDDNIDASETCLDDESDDDAGDDAHRLTEAHGVGDVIKTLRTSRKMSRVDMAANTSLTAARIAEIEDGDEPDDDELDEIASALRVSKKKMRKLVSAAPSHNDARQDDGIDESEFVEICDDLSINVGAENEGDDVVIVTDQNGDVVATSSVILQDTDVVDESSSHEQSVSHVAVFESIGKYEIDGRTVTSHRLSGGIVVEEKTSDGTLRFIVPLIKIGRYTANNNRYSRRCAEELVKDINKLYESRFDDSMERRSCLDLRASSKVVESFDMMPTHGPRIDSSFGNPLTSKAGRIVGAFIKDSDDTLYIIGETIPTQAGKDMSVLIEMKMVKGVSLVGVPQDYEINSRDGLDVDRLHFLGGDFTDNPAMPFEGMSEKETLFQVV